MSDSIKILHTADWHLGKKLNHFSRLEEQIAVLNEICEIADEKNVQLVVIAGDLFDTFNPSVEALDLFYKTLKRLSKNGMRPVVAIAGNHDSPERIDAPDPLAKACGIVLIGQPLSVLEPFEIDHGFKITKSAPGFFEIKLDGFETPVRIIATPYANEMRLKTYLGDEKETALHHFFKKHWHELCEQFCDANGINLLTTHLYLMPEHGQLQEEPDGEKPLYMGNASVIFSDAIPKNIQYTALGHLHRNQNIGTPEKPIIYSSSPLSYSFSEAGQTKYVVLMEAQKNNLVFENIALKSGKELCRKRFNSVEMALTWLAENPNTWVELTLESETFLTSWDLKRIHETHAGIVHLIPVVKENTMKSSQKNTINLNQDMMSLFEDYFKTKNAGQLPNESLKSLFKEISES
jgi:exonuclease SbcD